MAEDSLSPANPRREAPPAPVFSVAGLTFAYQPDKIILRDLDLELYPGLSLGLAGPIGSGKTTLLRCITGLERPQKGTIRLGEKIVSTERDFCLLRSRVGYVVQNADDQIFFPEALPDLMFGPLNLGLTTAEAKERALEALSLTGLDNFGHRLVSTLSGGEKKLLALAAILAMRPQALLLDEPLNALDVASCNRVENLILSLKCAKIVISHDPAFLKRVCDEIVTLSHGALTKV